MTLPQSFSPFTERPLGRTGLLVQPLCIGCAALGSMPDTFAYDVAEEQALATIRAIFDGPIHFLDTAASYGDGESERRLGVVLRERGGLPPGFVLATKADRNLQTGSFSGDQMRHGASLVPTYLAYLAVQPPSMTSIEPVTKDASPEAR
jgi:D-threo-aldose 1-dehydrogenase